MSRRVYFLIISKPVYEILTRLGYTTFSMGLSNHPCNEYFRHIYPNEEVYQVLLDEI